MEIYKQPNGLCGVGCCDIQQRDALFESGIGINKKTTGEISSSEKQLLSRTTDEKNGKVWSTTAHFCSKEEKQSTCICWFSIIILFCIWVLMFDCCIVFDKHCFELVVVVLDFCFCIINVCCLYAAIVDLCLDSVFRFLFLVVIWWLLVLPRTLYCCYFVHVNLLSCSFLDVQCSLWFWDCHFECWCCVAFTF